MATDSFIPSSSFIAIVKYDEVNRTMEVTFKNGSSTRYMFVYRPTYDAWKIHPSHGSYFAKNVKGKLLSVALVRHVVGKREKTALKTVKQFHGLRSLKSKHPLTAGLTGILKSKGLIPERLKKHAL